MSPMIVDTIDIEISHPLPATLRINVQAPETVSRLQCRFDLRAEPRAPGVIPLSRRAVFRPAPPLRGADGAHELARSAVLRD